jgi:transposase
MNRRLPLAPWERLHILVAYGNGEKVAAIAAQFGVSEATVNKIRKGAGIEARTKWVRRRPRNAVLEASGE